jgi:dephospho-CoA kinase
VLRVGLTGGLASGKSTVAALFRDLGAFHVDADAIAHLLLAPGGRAHAEVAARFGPRVVAPDGSIDRKALGALVFGDARALADLNALVHPKVRDEIARRLAQQAESIDPAPIAIVDAALLVEVGFRDDLDALVVVACRPETQLARAIARGGLTEAEARARIAAQAPLDAKLAVADYVIDNDGRLEETARRIRGVWTALLQGAD